MVSHLNFPIFYKKNNQFSEVDVQFGVSSKVSSYLHYVCSDLGICAEFDGNPI